MDIILSTVNARYMHSSFGLRYLFANMEELQACTEIREYVLGKNAEDLVEDLLAHNPRIVGFGVYIWNNDITLEVCQILKKIRPDIFIVLGGPEVSYETEAQEIYKYCDHVICGEADFAFRDLCREILNTELRSPKLIKSKLPEIKDIQLPYAYYSNQDVAHRVIYVEASRGCPYKCEYCLSSLDVSVRNFPLESFLQQMQNLLDRGVRQFKFVDRTFNLNPSISNAILQFFLDRIDLGLFLHFELVPDRLPEDLKVLISKFPKGSLQFEIGVQTWNPEVAKNVSRRQNYQKIQENFLFLRQETQVHTHADLIVGLPGETKESFAQGFEALLACEPDEIQVGILKRLKGAPLSRHEKEFQMLYADKSPFQLLQNRDLSYSQMQEFARFAKYWDWVANSGNFPYFTASLIEKGRQDRGAFWEFWKLSEFLYHELGQTHSVARARLTEKLRSYAELNGVIWRDGETSNPRAAIESSAPKRQQKRLEKSQDLSYEA